MAQVTEEARHDATNAPVATDDRNGVRHGVHWDFGPECGLMITTGSHEQPKDRLDLLAGQPQFRRVLMSIAQQLALATRIADLKTMQAFVGGDLCHQRHTLSHDLQQVTIERIDHGPHDGQWPRRISHGYGS